MKLRFAMIAAVVLALSLASPAAAQVSPYTVVDRNAVAITYLPTGGGASIFSASVSYRFGPTWDLLLGYSSGPGAGASALRIGARFHTRSPERGVDPFVTLQYSSETPAATAFLVGGGITAQVAPRVDLFGSLNYHSTDQIIYYDYGVQYQVSPQFSVIGGVNTALAYLGISMSFR